MSFGDHPLRIRTIKPEFFLHEALFDLEQETKLPIRVSFAGLWCAADREGRFCWQPRKLKAQIVPYDNVDFSRVLHALTTRGFLVKYASQGVEFGCIPTFHEHQFLNAREKPSIIPPPPTSTGKVVPTKQLDATTTRAPRVEDACFTRASRPFPSLPISTEGYKGGLDVIAEFKRRLTVLYNRKDNDPWKYEEEHALAEVAKRPNALSELAELEAYNKQKPEFFPRSAVALLSDWSKHLDSGRRPRTTKDGHRAVDGNSDVIDRINRETKQAEEMP